MFNKKLWIPAFAIMVVLQWYFPVQMIRSNEQVMQVGKLYKFRAAPVDPNDPFRGKFVVLNFRDTKAKVEEQGDWVWQQDVYLTFKEDEQGFAIISGAFKTAPDSTDFYLKAKVEYISIGNEMQIRYPFDRFYMEEFKAPQAEEVYTNAIIDTHQVAYASVRILNGQGVIEDVMIDGTSIRELVERNSPK